jgi:hypothetical protein
MDFLRTGAVCLALIIVGISTVFGGGTPKKNQEWHVYAVALVTAGLLIFGYQLWDVDSRSLHGLFRFFWLACGFPSTRSGSNLDTVA